MSAEIKDAADVEVRLVAGSGGVFDVRCDGKLVFSKLKEGRFPAVGELLQLI
ncbi:MAG: Rdx family protein [Gammaproteobacteria bacterium]|nr:Rdx family protein [Gammaproteobacteria bacterium]